MDSIPASASRFRFRNRNQEVRVADSSEGHTSADSSSISSNGDEESELQSMSAKGVHHLCSELLELKQDSDEDFQKNIFSTSAAFLEILNELEGVRRELSGLRYQASLQKKLIKDVSDGVSLHVLSDGTIESKLEEPVSVQPSSPSTLEAHIDKVTEILDTLLLEHRLDDALDRLEMEDEFSHSLLSGEKFVADDLMSYKSRISEKRSMLIDQFTLVATHPRVSPPELQKALSSLCRLGEIHLANKLLLQYYHSRISSGIHDLKCSTKSVDLLYIQVIAKYVCSMISRTVRNFVVLNGEVYPHASEITRWVCEEVEVLATFLNQYIASVPETRSRLSTAVDAMKIAVSYCCLLETQRISLQPFLINAMGPSIKEVLVAHIDHLSKVVSIITSSDTWVLGRYLLSGILTGRNAIIDQEPEYIFLSDSGKKFLTLLQSVAEDISPLIALQMERAVLMGFMNLVTRYINILESALAGITDVTEKGGSRINFPESPTQRVLVLANLSTLVQLLPSIIRHVFNGVHHLDFEIENYLKLLQDIYIRLKVCFLEQFISNIFCPNADRECGPESCIWWKDDSKIYDLIPSVPYLELYLELKKLQSLAEDGCLAMNWLIDLLKEVMDVTYDWISSKSKIWMITEENLADHRNEFMQVVLDTQFLLEIARCGGYLSDNAMNVSADLLSRVETSFSSSGMPPLRELDDDEWPASAARIALQKLQELQKKESLENDNISTSTIELEQFVVGSDIEYDNEQKSFENSPDLVHNSVDLKPSEFFVDGKGSVSRTEDLELQNSRMSHASDQEEGNEVNEPNK